MRHAPRTALVVGASRGLGLALAAELADRGWHVVGTVRDPDARTPLHELAERSDGRVTVERLDVADAAQLPPLRARLAAGPPLDLLFVSAGTTNNQETPIGSVPEADFTEIMVVNALAPLRVVEALDGLVAPGGLIGAMSSGQGSITRNTSGLREVYRGSKAALNMFFRSYAARTADSGHPLVLLAPGWIRTGLGGPDAPFTVEERMPGIVDVLLSRFGRPGLAFLDHEGETVPW